MAAPSNKKQIMDVAKPGKTSASATSRPIIVGHGSMIKDPMVSKDDTSSTDTSLSEKPATKTAPVMSKGPRVVQPLSSSVETTADKEEGPAEDPIETHVADEDAKDTAPEETAKVEEPDISEVPEARSPDTNQDKPEPEAEAAADKTEEPADEDSAAVVDAVVDQAAVNKQQKEQDNQAQERQEKVAKLIEEKKYFIPIKQPKRTRNGRLLAGVLIALLVLIAGGYAAVDAELIKPGFDVPYHFLRQDKADDAALDLPAQTAATTPAPSSSSQSTTTANGLTTYTSKDYGVSFSYPSTWGEVTAKKQNASIKGHAVVFGFSKQRLMQAGMLSKDYEEHGKDGTCFLLLGIMPTVSLNDIKGYIKEGDNTNNTASSKVTTKILKSANDTFIYENFEAGEVGMGSCPGIAVFGYKSFASGSYTGIEFMWADPSQKAVLLTDFTKYKSNPNDFLSEKDRKDFLAALDSTKTL